MKADSSVASLPTVGAGAQILRGVLAAVIAVSSAVGAHIVAGHHGPHPMVLFLTLCVTVPVCVTLARVRLSRWRLGTAVLFSQGILHGLFALFPHTGDVSGLSTVQSSHTGHHHHVEHLVVADPAATTVASHGVVPDAGMTLAHLSAGVLTYVLLRRGEVLFEALVSLLGLRPVLTLVFRPLVVTGPRALLWAASWPARRFSDLWPGQGPWTLRGPPAVS